jgi:hypothetical protein
MRPESSPVDPMSLGMSEPGSCALLPSCAEALVSGSGMAL